ANRACSQTPYQAPEHARQRPDFITPIGRKVDVQPIEIEPLGIRSESNKRLPYARRQYDRAEGSSDRCERDGGREPAGDARSDGVELSRRMRDDKMGLRE